jgi:hypothetical protein
LHSIRAMHDIGMRKRIPEQVSDLIGSLTNQSLGVNGKPAALTAIKNVVMMEIAMRRDNVAFDRQQTARDCRVWLSDLKFLCEVAARW